MKKAEIDTIFGQGEPNPYGQFFTGQTYLTRLSANDEVWNSSIANVTFEPGARTNWHKHSGGQILLVLGGEAKDVIRNAAKKSGFCIRVMWFVFRLILNIGTARLRILGLRISLLKPTCPVIRQPGWSR